jgi:hypothetical protein
MVYKYTAVIFVDADDQEEAHLKVSEAFEAAADVNNTVLPHLLADSRLSVKKIKITECCGVEVGKHRVDCPVFPFARPDDLNQLEFPTETGTR